MAPGEDNLRCFTITEVRCTAAFKLFALLPEILSTALTRQRTKGESMASLETICADVGSVAKGNFAWWTSEGRTGTAPSTLAAHLVSLLNQGSRIALGFECPLFVPLVEDEAFLTRGRPGEGSRPWSAGAGCGALATGLVEVAWVLQAVRPQLTVEAVAFVDWEKFVNAPAGLFLWEAFVSGTGKRGSHIADAQAAGEAFLRSLPDPTKTNAIHCTSPVYSLAGAALLRTGWSSDLNLLHQPCLVVRTVAKTKD